MAAWRELANVPYAYDTKKWYRLDVSAVGDRLRASVDGKPLVDVRDGELAAGIAGITANMPARFKSFRVTAGAAAAADLRGRIDRRTSDLDRLRADNPKPALWRKFDTPGFGAGRNVRFGDLDGDGRLDMLFAQNVAKVRGDAFDHISCLTAVTLEGRVLWQQGRPNPKNALLTNDTPFQIHDLDGDGRVEIVLARDFELQVLDGRTGRHAAQGVAATGADRSQGSAVRDEHRRLPSVRRSDRQRCRAGDRDQGPLSWLLGVRQGSEVTLAGRRPDRPLSVSVRRRRRRAAGVSHRLLAVGCGREAAVESRYRAEGSRRRAVARQFHGTPVCRGSAPTSTDRTKGSW